MNSGQIEYILKRKNIINPHLKRSVYACNQLPIHVTLPCYIISNLDPNTMPGSHWIAIYINENGNGEYFDSFGRAPGKSHLNFINRNCKSIIYNTIRIQNYYTSVCGQYCLVYLFFKYMKCSMNYFLSMFECNTMYNDLLLTHVYNKIFQ